MKRFTKVKKNTHCFPIPCRLLMVKSILYDTEKETEKQSA